MNNNYSQDPKKEEKSNKSSSEDSNDSEPQFPPQIRDQLAMGRGDYTNPDIMQASQMGAQNVFNQLVQNANNLKTIQQNQSIDQMS